METVRLRTAVGRKLSLHGTPWISMVNVGPTGTSCLGKALAASPCMTAQVLTYLRLTGARRALLMNFNGVTLKQGLRSYLGMGNFVPKIAE